MVNLAKPFDSPSSAEADYGRLRANGSVVSGYNDEQGLDSPRGERPLELRQRP